MIGKLYVLILKRKNLRLKVHQIQIIEQRYKFHTHQELIEENLKEILEENQEDKIEQSIEVRLYFETHRKSDGTWTHPQAQENYEQMNALWVKTMEDGTEMTGRQILEKVLKPKSGYIHGLGYEIEIMEQQEELWSNK
ncbi:uncharacterized protein LOC127798114 isoform X2 [Diospyros lotus]|uniref:uncharacterized protein LOC127798114 isoform X2 n=1 Tax=Diospyros lotus TaxID=55363 RepID=UPI00224F6463|nr:uncharacterized protein LOC127798114 isoform X2 [Diospyros lotus]